MSRTTARKAFTLAEVMVSMALGGIVMIAIISTYLYLGRNLARLSYHRALEVQSRYILNTLATDIRRAKSVRPVGSTINITLVGGSTVVYSYASNGLTRDQTGAVSLLSDIKGEKVSVPVTITNFTVNYYTTTEDPPTFQSTSTVVPISVKQIDVSFTLQAGSASQGNSGTMTQLQVVSSRMLLRNRQLPDGT